MKAPLPMPADQILLQEFNHSSNLSGIKPPGSNPWIKYAIVGGIILLTIIIAYKITEPKAIKNEPKQD